MTELMKMAARAFKETVEEALLSPDASEFIKSPRVGN